ncbi:hypothetical protein [uncultured Desulfobacter sp.]|uniref:hypothetical protein n=1 Tax=uncultured Desulfobacter sp. TaxID=240139 RepID=UPI0029F54A16|nr:hypothetical protein [uncultured Desulfobacter sp.]
MDSIVKKIILGFIWGVLCLIGYVVADQYHMIMDWFQSKAVGGSNTRGIGTNLDLWRNGYLGLFFRFKIFGWLNWIAIPLFLVFLKDIKKKEPWQKTICLALFLSVLFICVLGYRNYRYQLTLFPVIIPFIFLYGYDVLKKKSLYFSMGMISICICLILGYVSVSGSSYVYYFKSALGNGAPGACFPEQLIHYINEKMDKDAAIKSINQPILYYYTDKKRPTDDTAASDYHVLVRGTSLDAENYELLIEDQGYKLYKQRMILFDNQLASLKKIEPKFEINIKELEVLGKKSIDEISFYIPQIKVLGKRNNFNFQIVSPQKGTGQLIRLCPDKEDFNVKTKILLGIRIVGNSLNLDVQDNDKVHLIVGMRQSKTKKGMVGIFIQDKTDYWARETAVYKGHKWKDVLVGKKIKEGFKAIAMGILWEPMNDSEWIEIKTFRVIVEKSNI